MGPEATPPDSPLNPIHRRDGRFFNPGLPQRGFREVLHWMRTRQPGPWPRWIPSAPGPIPPERVLGSTLRVTLVNHSTVLLQTEGLNLLTDPVWSRRVSPVSFAGPARHRAPGLRFEDLPPIDAILLSHDHYDHLDLPTLRRLARRHQPAVFCPLGVAKKVRRCGLPHVRELDWGQSTTWRDRRLHCIRAQHFAGRLPFRRDRTLWCGWLLEASAGNLYFAGDSGYGDFFSAIGQAFAPIRLALIPIGAYDPEWFMGPVHMTPEQAVQVSSQLAASTPVAIHYGTFALADDGPADPPTRLRQALAAQKDVSRQDGSREEATHPDTARTAAPRFWILPEGESRQVPAVIPAAAANT